MKMNRTTTITLLALAVLALLAWGFWPAPVLIEAGVVSRAPLSVTVEEEGRTRVKDRLIISAPVTGYLQRIGLEVGDPVTQGQTLALMEPLRPEVLDPRSRARAEAQVAAARAAISSAEQRAEAARVELRQRNPPWRRIPEWSSSPGRSAVPLERTLRDSGGRSDVRRTREAPQARFFRLGDLLSGRTGLSHRRRS